MSFSFEKTVEKLISTPLGKEASMYGPIRDLLINCLNYPANDVDIDTSGEGGRPDVTARSPSGRVDAGGKPVKIDWIVVEAKDEHGSFHDTLRREEIFRDKSKYVGINTAWFVMIDPDVCVLRRVTGQDFSAVADIEIEWQGLTKHGFERAAAQLDCKHAGVPDQLRRFRQGDESLIATELLNKPLPSASPKEINRFILTRRRFYNTLRESTTTLQDATRYTLTKIKPYLKQCHDWAEQFGEEFHGWNFQGNTLTIRGNPEGPTETRAHDRRVAQLRKEFSKSPHLARLALEGLPAFQQRTGATDQTADELFTIETANLVLARILLIRFFEDHGFFGPLRYVCNGGIDAFQKMRQYFKASYTRLLEEAYRSGSRLYAAAFDETELDWISGADETVLSEAIEWTMFQFSRYDFKTVKGDILTGIYDRFMDRAQRKRLGEFYTPPSVARYIVKRVGITRESRVLDPACGSGTFLLEAFHVMVGTDIERGLVEYKDVQEVLSRIAGNDLNTFSSVLSQIQILWQILILKDAIMKHGFPDLLITGKVNSLIVPDQFSALERFAELDQPEYDAVIGNPPYVRQERSAQKLDAHTIAMFEGGRENFHGISAKRNAYTLFIYRALDSWCKPSSADGGPGKLGFIVPVSLFDANETEDLRNLFAVGQRWTIKEIIDLEVIYKLVFDADVLPAIVIFENRPATLEDTVSIRLATRESVHLGEEGALPTFDLEGLPEQHIPYQNIFTPEGRIMTRLTPARLEVIRKIWRNDTFGDIAKRFWVRKQGSKIVEWTATQPKESRIWTEQKMIGGGIAFRGERQQVKKGKGFDIYKGENIIAAELQGDPAATNIDIDKVNDNSLWAYRSILPELGIAVPRVAHCPNAVRFNPKSIAFTNTATLLFPVERAAAVPFDLILLSNVYVFFYALAARMGVLRTLRSDIYPTNLAYLPWSDRFIDLASSIENFRKPVMEACQQWLKAEEALHSALTKLPLKSLKQHLRLDESATIQWGTSFDSQDYKAEVKDPGLHEDGESCHVLLSSDLLDRVKLNRKNLAKGLVEALTVHEGEELGRSEILNMHIPATEEDQEKWKSVLGLYRPEILKVTMEKQLEKLDAIVGKALGLSTQDLIFIRKECAEDPFLSGIRPRYPGTETRKQGFRTGLDSSDRYE